MAFQVKVEYGKKRFETFLPENVSYNGLVTLKKYCSSSAQIDADKIRLRFRDEDCEMVNGVKQIIFAFLEMLFTAKDRDPNKIFIQANEIKLSIPAQNEASGICFRQKNLR